jgi:hypothetical protein
MRVTVDDQPLSPVGIARLANTALIYMTDLSSRWALAQDVEVRARLHNVVDRPLWLYPTGSPPEVSSPIFNAPGFSLDPIGTDEYLAPAELRRSSVRHAYLMRFLDRVMQAAGERQAGAPFRRGELYDQAGVWIRVLVAGGLIVENTGSQIGWITSDGSLRGRQGDTGGWYQDGVIIDSNGDTIAVLEMAPGVWGPDDFVATSLAPDAEGMAPKLDSAPRQPPAAEHEPPAATGSWSTMDLRTHLGW